MFLTGANYSVLSALPSLNVTTTDHGDHGVHFTTLSQ